MTTLTVSKAELLKALDVCIVNCSTGAYLIEGLSPVEFLDESLGSWLNLYSGFDEYKKDQKKESLAEEEESDLYNEYLTEVRDFVKSNLLDEVNGFQINYID